MEVLTDGVEAVLTCGVDSAGFPLPARADALGGSVQQPRVTMEFCCMTVLFCRFP